jgi:hypothetical protein
MMRHLIGIALAGLTVLFAGCGDEDGADGPCGQTATAFCDAACDCSSNCRIRFESGSTQSFGNEVETSRDQCLSAITGSCNDGTINAEACEADVAAAACVDTGGQSALELPASCSP